MTAETDLQTAWGKLMKLPYDVETFAVGTYGTTTELAAISGAIATANPVPQNVIDQMHRTIFGMQGFYSSAFQAYLAELGRTMGYPETDPLTIFTRYFHACGAGSVRVKSRSRTLSAFADPGSHPGANYGNGSIVRLTKDQYGFNIENGADEVKTATCILDERTGARRWSEVFRFRGTAPTRYVFPYRGAGSVLDVTAISIADTSGLGVQNPGFETYDATNKFQGWRSSVDGTTMVNWTQDTTRYYKDVLPGTTPGAAIQAVGTTDYLYQTVQDVAKAWDPNVPLYAQVAYMRRGSATGTLRLRIGDIEATVNIALATNDEWNVLRWPLAAPAATAWFYSWNAANTGNSTNPFVRVGVDTLAVGTCLIDDLIIAPYVNFDGSWVAVISGPANSANTAGPALPWLVDDQLNATDSSAATAKVQQSLAKGGGVYLPSVTDGSQTWPDF